MSLTIGVAAGPFIIVTTLVRMLRGAPPSPEGYVRADAEGLREHGPGRVTALAWGDIASVRRKRLGQSMLYFATSVDARERITWWTKGAPTLPRDPWEVNATLVSAEELAALVARRSGRAVEDFSAVQKGNPEPVDHRKVCERLEAGDPRPHAAGQEDTRPPPRWRYRTGSNPSAGGPSVSCAPHHLLGSLVRDAH